MDNEPSRSAKPTLTATTKTSAGEGKTSAGAGEGKTSAGEGKTIVPKKRKDIGKKTNAFPPTLIVELPDNVSLEDYFKINKKILEQNKVPVIIWVNHRTILLPSVSFKKSYIVSQFKNISFSPRFTVRFITYFEFLKTIITENPRKEFASIQYGSGFHNVCKRLNLRIKNKKYYIFGILDPSPKIRYANFSYADLFTLCDRNITDLLLKKGCDVNKCIDMHNGLPLLHAVIVRKENNVLRYILSIKNIKVDGSNELVTPLYTACEYSNLFAVKILLNKGCDVNKGNSKSTPLCHSCKEGEFAIATLLVEFGADVNQFDCKKYTPLYYLAQRKEDKAIAVTQHLIAKGADPNVKTSQGFTPLHIACGINNISMVSFLLGVEGIMVNCVNINNSTPLHFASSEGHTKIVSLLLGVQGILVNFVDKFDTPLHMACYYGHTKIVSLLLNAGANSNIKFPNGESLLEFAYSNEFNDIVVELCKYESIVKTKVLDKATKDNNYPLLYLLLDDPVLHENYCGICFTIKKDICRCTTCKQVV